MSEPKTHDYTKRHWGHDYTFETKDGGQHASMTGWGAGIAARDYLILENGGSSTRYQVDEIDYYADPQDMWRMKATFAPRQAALKGEPQCVTSAKKISRWWPKATTFIAELKAARFAPALTKIWPQKSRNA